MKIVLDEPENVGWKNYGCWNVAKIISFITCFKFMLYEVFFVIYFIFMLYVFFIYLSYIYMYIIYF